MRTIPCDCSAIHIPTPLQMPKEEFPPSPECWRQHPSKPNAVPYCYFKKPEIYTHWHTLYDQQQERETQKMLQKMRDHPRYALPFPIFHNPLHLLRKRGKRKKGCSEGRDQVSLQMPEDPEVGDSSVFFWFCL